MRRRSGKRGRKCRSSVLPLHFDDGDTYHALVGFLIVFFFETNNVLGPDECQEWVMSVLCHVNTSLHKSQDYFCEPFAHRGHRRGT